MRQTVYLFLLVFLFSACQKELTIEEGYVSSLGDSIYYKSIGEGDPIIIVHGGPVLDHQYLYDHILPLAQDYQLIFYDQRACGKSQLAIPKERMSFEALTADIEAIRQYFGYQSIGVLGHSWGGLLAMHYAIDYQEHLDHLILLNSMAPSAEKWNSENKAIADRYSPKDQEQLNKLSSSGLLRTSNAAPYIEQMMKLSYKPQFYDRANLELLQLHIPNDYHERSAVFMHLAQELVNYDLSSQLAAIQTPTQLVYGETEPAVSLHLKEFASIFSDASTAVIPRSGHFPFIEQPDLLFEEIRTFLEKN